MKPTNAVCAAPASPGSSTDSLPAARRGRRSVRDLTLLGTPVRRSALVPHLGWPLGTSRAMQSASVGRQRESGVVLIADGTAGPRSFTRLARCPARARSDAASRGPRRWCSRKALMSGAKKYESALRSHDGNSSRLVFVKRSRNSAPRSDSKRRAAACVRDEPPLGVWAGILVRALVGGRDHRCALPPLDDVPVDIS
jgi:hypothetical protein